MKNWGLYRLILGFLPARRKMNASDMPKADAGAVENVLNKHRCLGASLCLFDQTGITGTAAFGVSHQPGTAVTEKTVFRAASVSKFVTALGAMKLKEQGRLDFDRDVNEYLPFSLRHPKAPDTPITLRMLLSHTAGIHDGVDYNTGIVKNVPMSELLRGDSFTGHLPGEKWEYSNFGAGIAGAVMEAAADRDFETLMQETVFHPLGVTATYYPQKVQGDLADAVRILPRSKTPNFNAAERRTRPMPPAEVNPEAHYNLAHGSLCVSAPELAKLGMAGMKPGFLAEESLEEMRHAVTRFGERASNLSQGIGTFVLHDGYFLSPLLYGHQGMAYGAVHGLFFDPERQRGFSLLTTGASEARRGVLADLNFEMICVLLGDKDSGR
ncbi:MAG: beta-lactamase family protein [Clostridia bacterium]|nr:beta-lactamase family protein [Clostridia bacterium]